MLSFTSLHFGRKLPVAGALMLLASGLSFGVIGTSAGYAQTAASCTADEDCGWDNACMPQRCVAATNNALVCAEARPAPGTCSCINDRCTLRLEGLAASNGITPSCSDASQCLFDPRSGRCTHANANADAPIWSEGAYCSCEYSACMVQWVDPIPCETALDCAVGSNPVRPTAAVPARESAFVPCVDGELAPVCTNQGFCAVVGFEC